MDKYEYKSVKITVSKDLDSASRTEAFYQELNEWGNNGWLLVSEISTYQSLSESGTLTMLMARRRSE